MAELADRGITINRTLAWTMLVSVAALIWWGGGTLASLQGAAERLTAARRDVRFDALSASIDELKQQARQTNDLLRELTQRP